MVSRVLVTTALEETWPGDDVPVLFLGEWCRRYDRKPSWEKLNATIAPYHWDDREKLYKDYLYLEKLYEELLSELAARLNGLHAVNYSVRYWRILAGPWLGYFVQMLFDRWAMLRLATTDADISGVRVLRGSTVSIVPNDMEDFTSLFVGDVWNEAIYGQLLAWMKLPVEKIDARADGFVAEGHPPAPGFLQKLKRRVATTANLVSVFFCRDREYFFIESYLPVKQDFLLQIKLGQIPKLWRTVAVPVTSVDPSMREWEVITPAGADDFALIARVMLSRHIPTAYLEGYRDLIAVTEKMSWPKHPAAIFTSNSYSGDDVFKAWAAEKVEKGAPLLIGQHGGNMGMAKWAFYEEHQIAICDRFLTWGWSEKNRKNVYPVGNLKVFGRQAVFDRNGLALLVEMVLPQFSYHLYSAPMARQWLDYFEDQCRFVQSLPDGLRKQVLVRLYAQDYGWGQKQRWLDRFPGIALDEGEQPMASLVESTRIYISTYNATTYLESLSLNVPTIMFWNPLHWELRDSAVPFFESLKSVGIFHDTPESAARHMALVWEDVSSWWDNEVVQAARCEFCEQYAHTPQKPLMALKRVLREVAREHRESACV